MLWLGLTLLLAVDPTASSRAHLGSGLRLAQSELYTQAAAEFEQALAQDPRNVEARTQLAICYFQLRNYDRARELLHDLPQSRAAAHLVAYYLGRMDLTDQNFDSAVRRFRSIPPEDPFRDELYYLGVAYYKQEQFDRAAAVWKRAAARNPRDSRIHQYLARAFRRLGREAEAEAEFRETRRLQAYYLEGSAAVKECGRLLAQGASDQEQERCRALLDTDDVDKIVALGMAFGQAGRYSDSLGAWEKALALDPESPEINYNLALTCYHLKQVARSRQYAAEAVRLRPDFPEANVLYGTVLYLLAEDKAALAVLRRAHELQPDDTGVRKLLAKELAGEASKLADAGQWPGAADLMQQAASLEPGSPEIAGRLAEFRARAGRAP